MQISNEELKIADLPSLNNAREIFSFGMTFNGYEHYGSLEASADAFRRFQCSGDKQSSDLTEIRNALFFCCRASRHMQVDDYIEYYAELQPLLVREIEKRKT